MSEGDEGVRYTLSLKDGRQSLTVHGLTISLMELDHEARSAVLETNGPPGVVATLAVEESEGRFLQTEGFPEEVIRVELGVGQTVTYSSDNVYATVRVHVLNFGQGTVDLQVSAWEPREQASVAIIWDPETLSAADYAELVAAVGDLARAAGALGIERVRSAGYGTPVEQGVPA